MRNRRNREETQIYITRIERALVEFPEELGHGRLHHVKLDGEVQHCFVGFLSQFAQDKLGIEPLMRDSLGLFFESAFELVDRIYDADLGSAWNVNDRYQAGESPAERAKRMKRYLRRKLAKLRAQCAPAAEA